MKIRKPKNKSELFINVKMETLMIITHILWHGNEKQYKNHQHSQKNSKDYLKEIEILTTK